MVLEDSVTEKIKNKNNSDASFAMEVVVKIMDNQSMADTALC